MNKEKMDLADLVRKTVVDTTKFSAVAYPLYAGIMSEIKDIGFYDSLIQSWPFLLGAGVANAGIKGVRYIRDNYQIAKKE